VFPLNVKEDIQTFNAHVGPLNNAFERNIERYSLWP